MDIIIPKIRNPFKEYLMRERRLSLGLNDLSDEEKEYFDYINTREYFEEKQH